MQGRARKLFQLIYCGCGKGRNYHRTFALKAVAGVFAVLRQGGTIGCAITGHRKYSADLAQGRQEAPYTVASVNVEHVEWCAL